MKSGKKNSDKKSFEEQILMSKSLNSDTELCPQQACNSHYRDGHPRDNAQAVVNKCRGSESIFNARQKQKHLIKTFIGRAKRGFHLMDAQIVEHGEEGIAPGVKVNHRKRCKRLRRLYERVCMYLAKGRMRMLFCMRWIPLTMSFFISVGGHAGTIISSTSSWAPTSLPASAGSQNVGGGVPSTWDSTMNINTSSANLWSLQPGMLVALYAQIIGDSLAPSPPFTVTNGTLTSWTITHAGGCTIKPALQDGYSTGDQIDGTSIAYVDVPDVYTSQTPAVPITASGPGKLITITYPHLLNVTSSSTVISEGNDQLHPVKVHGSITSGCRVTAVSVTIDVNLGATEITLTPASNYGLTLAFKAFNRLSVIAPIAWPWQQLVIPVGTKPSCNFAQSSQTTNLGSVPNVVWQDIEKISVPAIDVRIQCTGDATNGLAGTARVYGSSTTTNATFPDLATFDKEPNLGISLRPPATDPAGTASWKNNINAKGNFILGNALTDKLWWSWSLPAKPVGGTYNLPAYSLTPMLRTLGSSWGKNYDEDLTATITLNLVTE